MITYFLCDAIGYLFFIVTVLCYFLAVAHYLSVTDIVTVQYSLILRWSVFSVSCHGESLF